MAAGGASVMSSFPVLAASSRYHVVAEGETLHGIALTYGISLQDLLKTNKLRTSIIHPGDRIFIPIYSKAPDHTAELKTLTQGINSIKPWRNIVIHHSATPSGSAEAFDKYHRKRGMENGLAYHFVIGNGNGVGDGLIQIGNRWKKQLHGGHVKSNYFNQTSIGICLVGNFEKHRPTAKQIASLKTLTGYLKNDLLNGKPRIAGHRELKTEQTLCPGRYFPLRELHQYFG